MQLNSILFSKTLVRKDIASTGSSNTTGDEGSKKNGPTLEGDAEEPAADDFSSKAQIMTLMTTDVDRVSNFSWHLLALVGEFPISVRGNDRKFVTTYRCSHSDRGRNTLPIQLTRRLLSIRITRDVLVPPIEPLRWKGHSERPRQPHEGKGREGLIDE